MHIDITLFKAMQIRSLFCYVPIITWAILVFGPTNFSSSQSIALHDYQCCRESGQCHSPASLLTQMVTDQEQLKQLLIRQKTQIEYQEYQIERLRIELNMAIGDWINNARSCKEILDSNLTAPSGIYSIITGTRKIIEVYCEMGLNGGGYTFLSPRSLTEITNADIQAMKTDNQSLLMRTRRCDGTQPYAVLEQLPSYATVSIKFALNDFAGYISPINSAILGPYLYAAFLPVDIASSSRTTQGFKANGVDRTYINNDTIPNSYIALFPNFAEKTPSDYGLKLGLHNFTFCSDIFSGSVVNPSTRVLPPEYFMFGEFHFGGGGCYTQTDSRLSSECILGHHLGFR